MKTTIHESERHTRNEYQSPADSIFVIDLNEMRFIEASPPILSLLGYTKEELLGKIPQDVIFINEAIIPLFNSTISSKDQHRTIRTEYKRKDNRTIEVEAYIWYMNLLGKGTYMLVRTTETKALNDAQGDGAFYTTLFNNIPEAVVATDASFCISSYNRCAQQLFGWKNEEAIGTYASELIGFVYPKDSPEDVKKLLIQQDIWNGEVLIPKRDGDSFNAVITITALKDDAGNITGTVSLISDITLETMLSQAFKDSTRILEQRLWQETQDLARILERISDGFMSFDRNWRYTYINKRAAEAINRDPKEVIGTSLWNEFSESEDALRYQDYRRAMDEQRLISREVFVESIQKWFEEVLYPSPEGLSLYLHDVTTARNARLALQESEDLYRKAQSMGKLGHWIRDLSTNETRWSDETYSLFGIKKATDNAEFDTYLSFVHPDDRERLSQALEHTIHATKPLDIVYRVVLPDGSIRYMHSVAELIYDQAGRAVQLTGMIQDITTQKLTEEALLLSEKNYRLLFEENPVPIWMTDAEHSRFVDVNEAALAQYGYTKEEFVGLQSGALCIADDHSCLQAEEQKRTDIKTVEYITSHKKKNGEIIHINIKASLIVYKERQVWLIAGRDITQDLLYDRTLRESQKQLSLIFNSTQNAMWLLTIEGKESLRFEAVNDAFVRNVDINKEEIVGRLLHEVFTSESSQLIFSRYYECISTGVAQKFVAATRLKQGERLIHLNIIPIKDENGKLVKLLAVSEDITAQKKAENKLIESEEKYRILFERSPLPKLIFDEKTLRFLEVNMAAVNLYGYTVEEFHDMNLFDLRHADTFHELIELFKEGVPPVYVFDTVHQKKNGDFIKVNLSANYIPYQNKNARMAIIVDRTEQEKARDELITTTNDLRELASHLQNIREEERSNMAREIHDELGQQLTGLKMDISWLRKKLATENEPIRRKIDTSLELIDMTINTVRKIATQLRPSILDDLGLAEAIKWHSSEFSKRTSTVVTLDTDVEDSNLSPAISIALFRVYQESLTNVARHANATAVHSSLKIDGTHILLTVADNGTGFNISEQMKRKTLGLLGMKERVTMFNGKYSIESTPGKGTQVVVKIPLA